MQYRVDVINDYLYFKKDDDISSKKRRIHKDDNHDESFQDSQDSIFSILVENHYKPILSKERVNHGSTSSLRPGHQNNHNNNNGGQSDRVIRSEKKYREVLSGATLSILTIESIKNIFFTEANRLIIDKYCKSYWYKFKLESNEESSLELFFSITCSMIYYLKRKFRHYKKFFFNVLKERILSFIYNNSSFNKKDTNTNTNTNGNSDDSKIDMSTDTNTNNTVSFVEWKNDLRNLVIPIYNNGTCYLFIDPLWCEYYRCVTFINLSKSNSYNNDQYPLGGLFSRLYNFSNISSISYQLYEMDPTLNGQINHQHDQTKYISGERRECNTLHTNIYDPDPIERLEHDINYQRAPTQKHYQPILSFNFDSYNQMNITYSYLSKYEYITKIANHFSSNNTINNNNDTNTINHHRNSTNNINITNVDISSSSSSSSNNGDGVGNGTKNIESSILDMNTRTIITNRNDTNNPLEQYEHDQFFLNNDTIKEYDNHCVMQNDHYNHIVVDMLLEARLSIDDQCDTNSFTVDMSKIRQWVSLYWFISQFLRIKPKRKEPSLIDPNLKTSLSIESLMLDPIQDQDSFDHYHFLFSYFGPRSDTNDTTTSTAINNHINDIGKHDTMKTNTTIITNNTIATTNNNTNTNTIDNNDENNTKIEDGGYFKITMNQCSICGGFDHCKCTNRRKRKKNDHDDTTINTNGSSLLLLLPPPTKKQRLQGSSILLSHVDVTKNSNNSLIINNVANYRHNLRNVNIATTSNNPMNSKIHVRLGIFKKLFSAILVNNLHTINIVGFDILYNTFFPKIKYIPTVLGEQIDFEKNLFLEHESIHLIKKYTKLAATLYLLNLFSKKENSIRVFIKMPPKLTLKSFIRSLKHERFSIHNGTNSDIIDPQSITTDDPSSFINISTYDTISACRELLSESTDNNINGDHDAKFNFIDHFLSQNVLSTLNHKTMLLSIYSFCRDYITKQHVTPLLSQPQIDIILSSIEMDFSLFAKPHKNLIPEQQQHQHTKFMNNHINNINHPSTTYLNTIYSITTNITSSHNNNNNNRPHTLAKYDKNLYLDINSNTSNTDDSQSIYTNYNSFKIAINQSVIWDNQILILFKSKLKKHNNHRDNNNSLNLHHLSDLYVKFQKKVFGINDQHLNYFFLALFFTSHFSFFLRMHVHVFITHIISPFHHFTISPFILSNIYTRPS